jgi:hypothetical protein
LRYPGVADEFGEFLAFVGAMQASRDQNGDRVQRNAFLNHRLDHRAKKELVRHWACDIADQNAGTASPACEDTERWGADWRVQGLADGRRSVREFGEHAFADDRRLGAFGQIDRQMAFPEEELDRFACHAPTLSLPYAERACP